VIAKSNDPDARLAPVQAGPVLLSDGEAQRACSVREQFW
jgi:hypothetical protein